MPTIDSAINIDDLKRMAKRRLPKIMFDFIEGGVEDEVGLRTNANAFRDLRLVPRYYVDTSKREQTRDAVRPHLCQPVRHRAHRHGRRLPPRRRAVSGPGGGRGGRAVSDVRRVERLDGAGREAGAEEPLVSDLRRAGPRVAGRSGEARHRLRPDDDRGDLRRPGVVEPRAQPPQRLRPPAADDAADDSGGDAAPGLGHQLLPHRRPADARQLAALRGEGRDAGPGRRSVRQPDTGSPARPGGTWRRSATPGPASCC